MCLQKSLFRETDRIIRKFIRTGNDTENEKGLTAQGKHFIIIYTNKCSYLTRKTVRGIMDGRRDFMTEFDYDCLQRRQTAYSARHRVGNRRSVTLPSDFLTLDAMERRNGPCRTYRLGSPMTLETFEAMPSDLQKLYLRMLRQRGGSEADVEQMLGMAPGGLRRYRIRFDQQDPKCWRAFLLLAGKEEG